MEILDVHPAQKCTIDSYVTAVEGTSSPIFASRMAENGTETSI
jgi:hypothetical protein